MKKNQDILSGYRRADTGKFCVVCGKFSDNVATRRTSAHELKIRLDSCRDCYIELREAEKARRACGVNYVL